MQVVGRVVFAPLESRLPARVMAMGVFAVLTLAMVWLMFVSAAWGVAVFVILFGTSVGAMTLARPVLIADLYGSAQYGRISSVMSFFITFAATGAPFVAGLLYDAAGNYDLTIVLMIGFALVSVGTMYFVHIPEAREMSTIGVAGD